MQPRTASGEIRFGDVETFLTVVHYGSLHATARNLGVTASQISKAMTRLERSVGARLLTRGAPGVQVSDTGRRLIPDFVEVVARVSSIRSSGGRNEITMA